MHRFGIRRTCVVVSVVVLGVAAVSTKRSSVNVSSLVFSSDRVLATNSLTSQSSKIQFTLTKKERSYPHIVYVLADDLGWHDVGFHNGGIPTPNIDKLAREGCVLSNYYVQPTCSPTRATILTGRHVSNHGVTYPLENFKPVGLPEDEVLLPEILRNLGYSTHAVGKWHLGFYRDTMTPTFRGFQTFYGYYGLGIDYLQHFEGEGRDLRREESENCGANCSIVEDALGQYSSTLFTERTKSLIRMHDAELPLFVYLAWQAVHAPMSCFCEDVDPLAADASRDRCFACMLMHADKGLGEIMTELSDKQMLDDTIIIFSTDNGGATSTNHHAVDDVGSSNFPLRGGKHALFEGGVHGVGVVWLGSRVEGGARLPREYDMIMGSVDWLPTLLAAAGVHDIPTAAIGLNERLGKPIDGVSHWEALLSLGQGVVPDRPRDSLFIGAAVGGYKFAIGLAMRSGKWKLIVNAPCAETQPHGWSLPNGSDFATQTDWPGYGDGTNLLFDLSVDPEERNECSRENQDVVQEIRMLLSEHQQSPYISRLLDIEDRSGMVGAPIRGVWGPWVYSNVLR